MEILESLRKELVTDGLLELISSESPKLPLNQEAVLIAAEKAGLSFEPRLSLTFGVYSSGKILGIYKQTLVLSENYEKVVSSSDLKLAS